MLILAIETSCDETAAAVVKNGRQVLSSVVSSQVESHKLYGGVVPEIASRMHVDNIDGVVRLAVEQAGIDLCDIDAIGVTAYPGLIGALLVGVNFAKSLAFGLDVPTIPVHHIRGHVAANYITFKELSPPFMALVVSGGHSHIIKVTDFTDYKIIARTLDDAAGEAFDKVARTLGYEYPGGVQIDNAAKLGNENVYKLPKPKAEGEFNFSFSGLKTAVINLVHNLNQKGEKFLREDIAASFQKTIVDILSDNFISAAIKNEQKKLVVAGGVGANSYLREILAQKANENGLELYLPQLELCGDNAAMIASQAYYEYISGNIAGSDLNASAGMSIE